MLNTHLLKKAHAGQGKTACTLYKEGYNLYVLYEFQTLCSKGAPPVLLVSSMLVHPINKTR